MSKLTEAAEGIASAVTGRHLPPVEYDLTIDDDPEASYWRVCAVSVEEELSVGYKAVLELESEAPFVNRESLLGADAVLAMARAGHPSRRFAGVIRQVTFHGRDVAGNAHCTVEFEPAFACLDEGLETRRFQDRTVPEILKEVLGERLGKYARHVDLKLVREQDPGGSRDQHRDPGDTFPRRPWCVQYGESAHDFARRLMGEEGLSYFFDNSDGRERLVIVDTNAGFPEREGTIPIRPQSGFTARAEAIMGFSVRQQRSPGRITLRAVNLTSMNPELQARAIPPPDDDSSSRQGSGGPKDAGQEEVYDPAASVTLHRYDGEKYRRSDIDTQAKLRLEEKRSGREIGFGSGSVVGLQAGAVIEIGDETGLGGKYLVTRVCHKGHVPSPHRSTSEGVQGPNYENEFECIPVKVSFRAPRLPKPLARSFDRAVVTAPGENQLWTDKHGRVTVRFYWDREDDGPPDMTSYWVPVAFGWAGPGYGVQFIPRKGMEVLVGYVNGDPDQPIIVGCCESALTPLFAPTPEESPKSGIRSQSLRDNGRDHKHYSEISIDDTADHEKVLVRAGWDYERKVLHDEKTEVDHNQRVTVKGERHDTVHKDETYTVHGKRTLIVDQDSERKLQGNDTTTVTKNSSVTVKGARTTEISELEKGTFFKGRIEEVQGEDTLHVSEKLRMVADKELRAEQGPSSFRMGETNIEVKAGGTIEISRAGAKVFIADDGQITVASNTGVAMKCGQSSIELTPESIQLTSADGAIKLSPTGVVTSGTNVCSSAAGINEVTGALTKIN